MMEMIKVLFFIHDLGEGGAEKVLVNLVNNMNSNIFSITLISIFGGGINEQYLSPNIKYHAIFKNIFPANSYIMKLFTPRQLHKWFIKDKYDIEISYLEGPSARIVSGCPNKETKLISWIHCTMHSIEEVSKPFRNFSEAKKCYNQFYSMVYVSEACKEAFQQVCYTEGQQMVLYNSNDSTLIQYKMKEEIDDTSFKQYEFTWCGVGKLIPIKAFDRMLRIQKKLISEGKKTHLLILGDGPLRKELEKWCEIHEIETSVTFLGYQKNPYKYMRRCDLFVCSSLSEGFSTAATEALIVGIPVCTVEVSGMKELLGGDNEYGIVVNNDEGSLFNAIQSLIENKNLLEHYKQKAIERGRTFTIENTVKAVENFLMKVSGKQ